MSGSKPSPSDAWVFDLTEVRLNPAVPLPIQKLFEVARGILVYSLMYYPLLTLGAEQLFRVVEAAVAAKCKHASAPHITKFSQRIDWLVKHGHIPADERARWEAIVHLRNEASHPADQIILAPGMVLDILDNAVELIDSLFPVTPVFTES